MSEISLTPSATRFEARLRASRRRRRSDAGHARLPTAVEAALQELLATQERPPVGEVYRQLQQRCRRLRAPCPSRSTVYNAIERVVPPSFASDELPAAVRACLHNVAAGPIPGHQVVYAAFNYGDTRALSFAAGMPWSCLHRAAKMPGFRPKSLGLL